MNDTLQIDHQARALLTILPGYLRKFEMPGAQVKACVTSFAFYNGRERWIGIEVNFLWNKEQPALFFVFGESRNSDSLCVECWGGKSGLNPPTIATRPETAYMNRRSWKEHSFSEAAEYITRQIDAKILEIRQREAE